MLTGCAATDGLMTNVELPAEANSPSATATDTPAAPGPLAPGLHRAAPGKLVVTGKQRAYLDALAAGGVQPSSDLLALRIGSYVCQARAAGQGPQAVWDFVHPLVQTDVGKARLSAMAPTATDVDATTNTYIRIATEQLC
jgi:Protein of unknown function (DUF732)